jgi:hypothetical protein
MFTIVHSVLLQPLPFPEPDQLVTLHGVIEKFGEFWVSRFPISFSVPDFHDARRDSRTLSLGAWTYGGGTVSAPGEPMYAYGLYVSADLFSVLGVALSQGRNFRADEDRSGAGPLRSSVTAFGGAVMAGTRT